jgi:betaine lipid synthase
LKKQVDAQGPDPPSRPRARFTRARDARRGTSFREGGVGSGFSRGISHPLRFPHPPHPPHHHTSSDDKFRARFLWGRPQLLAACAARLEQQLSAAAAAASIAGDSADADAPTPSPSPSDLASVVWVDLGGGTGANVEMMARHLPIDQLRAVYIVDLCPSLCEQARARVQRMGWKNVRVVEGDACTFVPPEGRASLVTFSYSLSMIPPFIDAVDNATGWLAPDGLIGVTDFYVSSKYDLPLRQMPWQRRFFWRATFDVDNIDVGPERRAYLDSKLERVWEFNGEGSIPYVPYLRAPYYVWIGRPWRDGSSGGGMSPLAVGGGSENGGLSPVGGARSVDGTALSPTPSMQLQHRLALAAALGRRHHEQKVEAPPLFPPTFLYTQSWEDPEPDHKVLRVAKDDVCLTLTSGGCNALNLLLHGAQQVVSVDCNPAQSSLLELKAAALQQLDFEDVWLLFGEGRHPRARQLFDDRLSPLLSQKAIQFWRPRLWYFKQGLYYQGGMGKLCWVIQVLVMAMGLKPTVDRLCHAPTLEQQRRLWDAIPLVRFVKHGPKLLVWLFSKVLALLLFNRPVLWFGGGVPCKQYALIVRDGVPIEHYLGRTVDGIAESSSLRSDNYFYYNCLQGRFLRDNCPAFLKKENAEKLKTRLAEGGLTVASGYFLDELNARLYDKVILMDHVDWLDDETAQQVADALGRQVKPGGIVIWRSASLEPPYASKIAAAGFEVRCLQRATDGYMDRVNMYASFYAAERLGADGKRVIKVE